MPPTPVSVAPKTSGSTFASTLFGWDVFISFALGPAPRGSRAYASDLARKLRERDFTVFFSEEEAAPGQRLKPTLERALHRARLLVVVANRGTVVDPRWVRTEVEEYGRRHPDRPIIAINVGGALDDLELAEQANAWLGFRDRIWIDESESAVAEGVASDSVVARLATAPRGMRASRRWRATVATAFVVLAATAAAAVMFGLTAQRNAKLATSGRLAAESQLAAVRDPTLSSLLAVEAFRHSETAAAKAALLQAVGRHPMLSAELARFVDANGRDDAVHALAFSPDGRELAIGTASGRIAFVSTETLRLADRTLAGHAEKVSRLVYSPDGTRLASVGKKPDIRIWDTKRWVALGDLASNDPAWDINAVAFDAQGRRLASAGADLLIWDLETMSLIANLHNDAQFTYNDLVWSRDGAIRVLTTSGLLDTWDVASAKRVSQEDLGNVVESGPHIAETADGRFRMIDGRDTGSLLLWDVRDTEREPLKLSGHTQTVASFVFSTDGKLAASAGYDGSVRVWRTGTVETAFSNALTAHRGIVRAVAWVPGERRIATGGDDGRVYLWELEAPPQMARWLKTKGDEASALAFMPDGRRLVVPMKREIEFWDVMRGERVGAITTGLKAGITTLAVSADGRKIAAATGYGETNDAVVWELQSDGGYKERLRISLGNGSGHALAFVDGGRSLLIQDLNFITSYRIEGGEQLVRIKAGTFAVTPWPAKGALLFNEGGTIRAVDEHLAPARGLATMPKMQNAAFSIAPNPRNALAATLHQGLTDAVRLWNFETGQEIQPQFRGSLNEYEFSLIAFTPDGQTLVGAGRGLTLFDFETRRVIGTLRGGHTRAMKSFAMSPVSALAGSGSYDGDILIWDLNPANWATRACRIANRNPSCLEWRQFHGAEPYRPACPGLPVPAQCD